ncbi:MAG: hypothetical protein WCC64_16730 [Aliidongia sp.]
MLAIKRLEDEGARSFLAALGTEFDGDQQLNSANLLGGSPGLGTGTRVRSG